MTFAPPSPKAIGTVLIATTLDGRSYRERELIFQLFVDR